MMMTWKDVKWLGITMDELIKKYHFRSYLDIQEDVNLIVEYEYQELEKVKEVFTDFIYFWHNKNIKSYYHEWLGDMPEDEDICRLVIKLKF